jgi:hypothetical protein
VTLSCYIRSWYDYNVYPLSHYMICQVVNKLSFGTCFSLVVYNLTSGISWFVFLPFIFDFRKKSQGKIFQDTEYAFYTPVIRRDVLCYGVVRPGSFSFPDFFSASLQL